MNGWEFLAFLISNPFCWVGLLVLGYVIHTVRN